MLCAFAVRQLGAAGTRCRGRERKGEMGEGRAPSASMLRSVPAPAATRRRTMNAKPSSDLSSTQSSGERAGAAPASCSARSALGACGAVRARCVYFLHIDVVHRGGR
jgi:hypothetical protein